MTLSRLVAGALIASAPLAIRAQDLPPQALGAQAATRAAHVLAPKESRSPAERKLDSRLFFAGRAHGLGRAAANAPDAIPGFVQAFLAEEVAVDGTVFVVVKAQASPRLRAALESLGARDVEEFADYATVHARLPLAALPALAELDEVQSIGPREYRVTHRYIPQPGDAQPWAALRAKVGSVNWEGVAAHQASSAHAAGIRGLGVKLCVLSDGVTSLASRISSGNLPGGVTVLSGQAGSGDEGTAMLELAYDMAPSVSLGFATAGNSMAQFASNITSLRSSMGCDVIVDDVLFLNEGAFQDGPVARAVNAVTAAGSLYFSSAGNSGSLDKGTSATFEGDFSPIAAAIPAVITSFEGRAVTAHSFGGVPYTTLTRATDYVVLQWGERLGGSSSDYDIFVTNATGTTILGSPGTDSQAGSQDPFEIAVCTSCTFPVGARVYVVKYAGTNRAIRVNAIHGRLANATAGSIYGHMATSGAIAVGAVDVRSAGGGAFVGGGSNPTTSYSSDGSRRFFFTPSGGEVSPGNTLFATNGGTTLAKVDLAASDCGSTTTPGFTPFCGTSAAAPTAAAIAALALSAAPSAGAAQVKAALIGAALDIDGPGFDRNSGSGLPMAPAAVRTMLENIMVEKSFTPAVVAVGQASALRIQLSNPNDVPLSGVAFTDTYPSAIGNASSPAATVSGAGCTGSLVASPGGSGFALSAGVIPARTVCGYTVSVASRAAGSFVDASGAVTTPIALDSPGFAARLDVGALPGAPTGVTATAGNREITVTYAAPANTGGLPLVGFALECTPADGSPAASIAVSSPTGASVGPLLNGVAYTCTAAAINGIGTGPAATAAPATPRKSDQSITFTSAAPAAYPGGPGYTVSAQGSAGGTVTFSIAPAATGICALNAGVVSFLAAGTCTVNADLAGSETLNPAPQQSQSFAVVVPTTLVFDTGLVAFGVQSMATRSPPQRVTLANYTGGLVTVTGIAAPSQYLQSNDCGVLAHGASCSVDVAFAPAIFPGPLNTSLPMPAALTVTAGGAASPPALPLRGTAEKSLVTHFYRAILGRAADATGKTFWDEEALRLWSQGVDVNETWYVMAGYFFNSAEYLAAGKDDAAFVADLYNTFFNRTPDGAGLAYWVGQIQGGLPREVVMLSFMFSAEFQSFTRALFGDTTARPEVNVVLDFFRGVLNRLPDAASLQYWTGRLKAAQCAGPGAVYAEVDSISRFFIFSAEYNNRHRSRTQVVTDMYYSFLRRGGDAGGVHFWVNQLATGAMDLNGVRVNFLNSPEFAGRVQDVVAAGCQP